MRDKGEKIGLKHQFCCGGITIRLAEGYLVGGVWFGFRPVIF